MANKKAEKTTIPEFCKNIITDFDGKEHANKAFMWRGIEILRRNAKLKTDIFTE